MTNGPNSARARLSAEGQRMEVACGPSCCPIPDWPLAEAPAAVSSRSISTVNSHAFQENCRGESFLRPVLAIWPSLSKQSHVCTPVRT